MDNNCLEDQETIREFLVESYENLVRLDQDLVKLEKRPQDVALLGNIFRTIHTIKGACGFLAFSTLESITHQAESLLSQLREGKRSLTPALVSLILETVDATRKVLGTIEASGTEGSLTFADLTERLRAAAELNVDGEHQAAAGTPGRSEATAAIAKPPADQNSLKVVEGEQPAKEGGAGEGTKAVGKWDGVEKRKPWDGIERRTIGDWKEREADTELRSAVADSNIRVAVDLLDNLMDLVGELMLTRNQILEFNTEREDAAFNATSQRLNLITTELQEGVIKARMQPIKIVWNMLPRMVRDMAIALGKGVQLVMEGAETELDRTIIEAIKDPLMHIVRNSCDHGIETPKVRLAAGKLAQGFLTLRAYHEGGQVNIEISDDGAGIDVARVKQKAVENGILRSEQADKLSDREALSLIFEPGFSLAKTVTNISGRGVGMDVVKSHIEKIGGVVDVFSRLGEGTTVRIRIPLTLAIIPGLVITSGGERFVIPQVSLLELIRLDGDSAGKHIEYVHGTPVYRRRGSLLPITYLNQVLGLKSADGAEAVSMVVLQAEDQQFGLVVDGINDTQEIVVKPLSKQLKGLTLYAGATIMGDGRVALILDVLGIGKRSGVFGESREQARVADKQKVQSEIEQQHLLLFRSGSFDRLAVPLSLVARLEEFPRSAIEHTGGGQVVQYRNRILPLVSLRAVLEPGALSQSQLADPVQVVVINNGDRSVGMVVDQILDIAEEAVTVRQKSNRKGLLGSAVVGKRVTDFLDLNLVIRASEGNWDKNADEQRNTKKILVADASSYSRGMIRSGLDMAGYIVFEAANLDEAIRVLEKQPLDAVVAALDFPPNGSSALLAAIRRRPEWEKIPVLAVADASDHVLASAVRSAGFQDCQSKIDSTAILESLAHLVSAANTAGMVPECV